MEEQIMPDYPTFQASFPCAAGGLLVCRGDDPKLVVDGVVSMIKYFNRKYKIPKLVWASASGTAPWLGTAQFEAMIQAIREGKIELVKEKAGGYRISNEYKDLINSELTDYFLK